MAQHSGSDAEGVPPYSTGGSRGEYTILETVKNYNSPKSHSDTN